MYIVLDLTFHKWYAQYVRWTALNAKACLEIQRTEECTRQAVADWRYRKADRHSRTQFGMCSKMNDLTDRVHEWDTEWLLLHSALHCGLEAAMKGHVGLLAAADYSLASFHIYAFARSPPKC
jgi:hypothetical protein